MATGSTPAPRPPRKKDLDEIIVRSWPKVIFLYPVMIAGVICGTAQAIWGGNPDESLGFKETLGLVFFAVFCLNLLVISFEFSRFKTLAIFFFFVAVFFFLLYLNTRWQVFPWLVNLFDAFHITCSSSFYFATAGYLLLNFCGVFVTTRFNYWKIRSNEILHKEGFLGDVKRFPSPNLKMTKEISDVFEFLLLGSGRIVLYPTSEKQAIVLEHVLRVNAVERATQELLSAIAVEVESHQDSEEEETVGG
ncbi:MAG: hypothetical protein HY721_32750 [Planctomycetes bacterium]|nr:hypothetical protein [Planctomycetota bacterium]